MTQTYHLGKFDCFVINDEPGSKLDLSEIKKEYGKAFKETLEG